MPQTSPRPIHGRQLLALLVPAALSEHSVLPQLCRQAIVRFAGPDWETAVVPASARAMLSRFEEKAAHYESRVAQEAAPHV